MTNSNPYSPPDVTPIESDSKSSGPALRMTAVTIRWTVGAVCVGLGLVSLLTLNRGVPIDYRAIIPLVFWFGLAAFPIGLLLRVWRFPIWAGIASYQLSVLGLWSAVAIRWALARKDGLDGDLMGMLISWWMITAVVGCTLLCMPHRRSRYDAHKSSRTSPRTAQ